MMKRITVLFLVIMATLLPGCATVIAPLSAKDVDRFHGKRTLGARVEDQAIEFKSNVKLRRSEAIGRNSRIVATSWNGQLLLVGQVPSEEVRQAAGKTVSTIRHVEHVHNELDISPRNAWLKRASDGWITCRVKSRLLFSPDVPGRRIKVTTENGVVYLMGLVDHSEAELAVESA
jgi:osmotically-inducible protein OsmY